MHDFHLGNHLVEIGNLGEAFFLSHFGEILIEVAPFLALACGGFGKVGLCVAYNTGGITCGDGDCTAFKKGEELAGMAELLFSSFKKYCRNLLVTFLDCLLGKEGIT